jgi:hypothetical protein
MDNNITNTEQFKKVRRFFKLKGGYDKYIEKGDKITFVNGYLTATMKKEDIMKLEIPASY